MVAVTQFSGGETVPRKLDILKARRILLLDVFPSTQTTAK